MEVENSRTYMLTGATGFLGSHLMEALIRKGHKVIVLGRASGKESLAIRVEKLLSWFGLGNRGDRVETAEADLLKPRCGLDEKTYRSLCEKTDQVIHCASDTRFTERFRKEITDSNVHSLEAVLSYARDSRASSLFYISTAYTAGIDAAWCPEKLSHAKRFTNVYEETKAQAERIITEECGKRGMDYAIIRPSIVYGDSLSGRSNGFNALYSHVKSLYYLKEIYLNDIRKNEGKKARACHIYLDESGILHLPLKVFLPHHGQINLIPIDYFVSSVLAIMENHIPGNIYHVTSDHPKTLQQLAEYCESFLGIRGIQIQYGDPPPGFRYSPAESLLWKFLEPYIPYLSDTRVFERKNMTSSWPDLKAPDLTYEVFKASMDYAVSVNWKYE